MYLWYPSIFFPSSICFSLCLRRCSSVSLCIREDLLALDLGVLLGVFLGEKAGVDGVVGVDGSTWGMVSIGFDSAELFIAVVCSICASS